MQNLVFVFDILLPVASVLLPLALLCLVPRNREVALDTKLLRRLMIVLWGGTLAGLVAFVALRWFASAEAARHVSFTCFALLPFSIRAMTVKNPDWGSPTQFLKSRSASLTPRSAESLVPRGVWAVGWLLWGCCVVAALLRWREPFSPAELTRWWLSAGIVFVAGPFHLWLGSYCIARLPQEAEPLPKNPPADLLAAYAALRKSRARGLAAFSMVMLAGICIPLTAQAWTSLGPWWGAAGGIGGAAIGIWGGVFGARCSFRRARINAVVRRLGQGLSAANSA